MGDIASSVVELFRPESETRDTPEKQRYCIDDAVRLGFPGQGEKCLEPHCQMNEYGGIVIVNGVGAIVPSKCRQDPLGRLGPRLPEKLREQIVLRFLQKSGEVIGQILADV